MSERVAQTEEVGGDVRPVLVTPTGHRRPKPTTRCARSSTDRAGFGNPNVAGSKPVEHALLWQPTHLAYVPQMRTSEDNQDRFRRRLLTEAFADWRGRSQYGLLQCGQTFGSWCLSRGTHSCPHRSQRYPQICTFGIEPIYPREEYTSSM